MPEHTGHSREVEGAVGPALHVGVISPFLLQFLMWAGAGQKTGAKIQLPEVWP